MNRTLLLVRSSISLVLVSHNYRSGWVVICLMSIIFFAPWYHHEDSVHMTGLNFTITIRDRLLSWEESLGRRFMPFSMICSIIIALAIRSDLLLGQNHLLIDFIKKTIFPKSAFWLGDSKISFDISQSNCSNLGHQFWEISFYEINYLTDDSAI